MKHTFAQRRYSSVALCLILLILGSCERGDLAAPVSGEGARLTLSRPVFHANGRTLGHPNAAELREADGGEIVRSAADYNHFWLEIAPLLKQWSGDPRLNVNPNFVAAILTKESGFDSLAVSWAPANGLPQMTYWADADLREMTQGTAFSWMQSEVASWPRHPLVHSPSATRDVTLALLRQGSVSAETEDLFAPAQAVRGALFWLRLLENKWTTDSWPGGYGSNARAKLNGGGPLSEDQLLDLVTVSYNRGYDWVYQLVDEYGAQWTTVLVRQGAAGLEAADYLDRVRFYTAVYQRAPTS